jgi:type I restriction enzyme M protein
MAKAKQTPKKTASKAKIGKTADKNSSNPKKTATKKTAEKGKQAKTNTKPISTKNSEVRADLIWSIANKLVGLYKPHEYGKVILPFTVIKRFSDTLLPTRNKVLEANDKYKKLDVKETFLCKASGYSFYNTSVFTFDALLSDPENIEANIRSYINSFSQNVQDIIEYFKFDEQISKLAKGNALFIVIQEFCSQKAYLGAEAISSAEMGLIFEHLIKKFSESYNEEAGAHFTARDIVYLMTDLLIAGDKEDLKGEVIAKTVYDMAMGTSQMLACLTERIHDINPKAEVTCFGQEFNDETYAIAKSDMLIRGGDANNMKYGDTLDDDQFAGYTFDYIISNPPFGIDWKKEEKAVRSEHAKGDNGRFSPGLPGVSDGQMLFMMNGVAKLKDNGRMAIIQNGSPLQSGDAGGGQSEIRRYLIENDWLEAIVQLPNDMFYNTGITTYIWLVTKQKDKKRTGKIQLINAKEMYEKRRKSLGKKRNDFNDKCISNIIKVYSDFKTKDYNFNSKPIESKVSNNDDFKYFKITVETPLLDEKGKPVIDKKGKKQPDTSKRDTENISVNVNFDDYMKENVLPYNPTHILTKTKQR